jgi:OOP family OmpA-OmpF porin
MKKLLAISYVIFLFASTNVSFGQAYQNSWDFGFGFTYPRFMSTDVRPQEANYGGFISLQRNFTESVGFRLLVGYDHMKGRIPGNEFFYTNGTVVPSMTEFMSTDVLIGDLDLLYYLIPCSPVNPYLGVGVGLASYEPKWPSSVVNPKGAKGLAAAQFNLIFGSEWYISDQWNLITEFGFHVTDGGLDGIPDSREGIFGSHADGYMTLNAGVAYYFDRGGKSKLCDLYNGISIDVPYDNYPTLGQIDTLLSQRIPKEVEKQVVAVTPCVGSGNWKLYGINFEFNKSRLLPESYPILEHAVQTLKENPDMKVEIQGYCDYIGSVEYNIKLSERRANTVRDYLVKNGIDGGRLTTHGFGKSNPVGDNHTVIGRAQNRRIEFKILK